MSSSNLYLDFALRLVPADPEMFSMELSNAMKQKHHVV